MEAAKKRLNYQVPSVLYKPDPFSGFDLKLKEHEIGEIGEIGENNMQELFRRILQ